jgi:hypothetical protein
MSLCKEIEESKMVGKKHSYEKFMTTVLECAQVKINKEFKDIPVTAYIYAFHSDCSLACSRLGEPKCECQAVHCQHIQGTQTVQGPVHDSMMMLYMMRQLLMLTLHS